MNKQEAIERIKNLYSFIMEDGPLEVGLINKNQVLDIISQIDEPQKVTVPKFVAEWIESRKESFSDTSAIDMYDNLTSGNRGGYYHEVWLWVIAHHYDFIKAWHDGYEVEKEKLYTVEIPNPALDNLEFVIVLKRIRGRVCLVNTYDYMGRELSDEYKLTEAEIKQDFEWAFQFAKPVEDE